MKILVTGANGFIGSKTCFYLSEKGHEVSGLVRKQSNLKLLEGVNIKLIYGDITEPSSLIGVFQGIDIVVHTAGAVTDWGPYEYFEKNNLIGTQHVANEASESSVKRMVQISSVAIHGFGSKHTDEMQPAHFSKVAYSESKRQTESWLKEFSSKTSMEIAIIRPGNVYGPGDEKFIVPYLDLISKGQFVYVNHGRSLTCPTYIDNLVHGIELACFHAKASGEVFNITDGLEITWRQFTEALYDELNLNPTKRSIPFKMVYFISYLMELIYKILQIDKAPLLTRYRISNAGKDYHFSTEKAKRILNYKPVADFDTCIERTVEWYLLNKGSKV